MSQNSSFPEGCRPRQLAGEQRKVLIANIANGRRRISLERYIERVTQAAEKMVVVATDHMRRCEEGLNAIGDPFMGAVVLASSTPTILQF